MSELKELHAWTGFGVSSESFYILAAHPDQEIAPNGWELSTTRNTILLKITNRIAEYIETISSPLSSAWRSENGTAYCAAIMQNHIYLFSDGHWVKEIFSNKIEDIHFIWGFSGETPDDDVVYLCAHGAFFVREKGEWVEHGLPANVRDISYVHGLSPDEIYLCSNTELLMWDGESLSVVDGPRKSTPSSICVVSEDEIVAAATYADTWEKEVGWKRVDTSYKYFRTLMKCGNKVFAGTADYGVVRVLPLPSTQVTDTFDCLGINCIGDDILAFGTQHCYLSNGDKWYCLQLPSFKIEDLPK